MDGIMRIKVNRRSEAYRRVMSAGFRIRNINLIRSGELYHPIIYFKCICGTWEAFVNIRYDKQSIPKIMDVAAMIEKAGAISEDHLVNDGYTKEQIKIIRRAYA